MSVGPSRSKLKLLVAHHLGVAHRDGTGAHAVFTEAGGQPFTPAWSPGGSQIAFGRRNGSIDDGSDFWVVGADGSGLRRVTTGAMADRAQWAGRSWRCEWRR